MATGKGFSLKKLLGSIDFGSQELVGLDIGLSAIRIAEVTKDKNNNYKLQKYAFVPLPEGSLVDDQIHKRDDIIAAIKECLAQSGVKLKNVCIGLYGPNTIVRRLQLAAGTIDEIEDQVIWESEQYIPYDVDEATISFHYIGDNAGGGADVIMAATKTEVVNNFKTMVEDADLKVKIVDLDIFSLANFFELYLKSLSLPEDVTSILIDMGAQKTNLVVFKFGTLVFSKEMQFGGSFVTEEIQKHMELNYTEAEGLKLHGDENGNLPEVIVNIINDLLSQFYADIKKTLGFYVSASSDDKISHCFLTGGSSNLPGIKEGIESSLGLKTEKIEPIKVIEISKNINEDLLADINSSGTIAIGLAMRELK